MREQRLGVLVDEFFGVSLHDFIRSKATEECLCDHEIASCLNSSLFPDRASEQVKPSLIARLRREFGIRKANGFERRFEITYGQGAIEAFKKIVENPEKSLSDAGRSFGFSREYARQVYKKIYGHPYAKVREMKRLARVRKRLADSERTGNIAELMKVRDRIEAFGLDSFITKKRYGRMILTNGYRLAFRSSSKPRVIGRKAYFHISISKFIAQSMYDFLVCLCINDKKRSYFIIPRDVMPLCGTVSLLPGAECVQSKYARYEEAWHLLSHEDSLRRLGGLCSR